MIGKKISSSNSWAFLQAWLGKSTSVLIYLVFAIYLKPDDFGVFALVSVIYVVSELFIEQSVSQILIQNKGIRPDLSILILAITLGVFFSLLFFFGSSYVAHYYKNQSLEYLIKISSFLPVIFALNAIPIGILRASLRYDVLTKRTLYANVLSGIISMSVVIFNKSALALVVQVISYQMITLLFFLLNTRHYFEFEKGSKNIYVTFRLLLLNIFSKLSELIETKGLEIVIANFLGLTATGIYNFSYKIVQLITTFFASPLIDSSWGNFASLKSNDRLLKTVIKSTIVSILVISTPLMIMTSLLFQGDFIKVMSHKWQDVSTPISLLSLAMAVRIQLYLCGVAIQSTYPSLKSSTYSVTRSISTILFSMLFFKLGFDKSAAPCAYLLSGLILILPTINLLKLNLPESSKVLREFSIKSVSIITIIYTFAYLLHKAITFKVYQDVILCLLLCSVYLYLTFKVFRGSSQIFWRIIKNKTKKISRNPMLRKICFLKN